jgi:predicted regulator of Ras-like GTPase activity (Roadblock/LC7/MglB family)
MSMLRQILGEFLRLDGVTAAVVMGKDGFVIESAQSGAFDLEALGAMASTGIGTTQRMGGELGKGVMLQMMVEFESGSILFSPLSPEELVAIIGEEGVNVGRIRYELKKNKERIIAAL